MARRFGGRRFRRKPRVLWLQNIGTPDWDDNVLLGENPAYIDADVGVTLGAGRTPTINIPLLTDGPAWGRTGPGYPGGLTTTGFGSAIWQHETLASMQQYGYRLRRIVGKLHISVATGVNPPTIPLNVAGMRVTAALIVRKVDPETGVSTTFTATAAGVNTQSLENIRDPYIWRRSWTLPNSSALGLIAGTNNVGATELAQEILQFPPNTASYGSVADGGNVDQKTARNVGPDERLFLDISCRNILVDDGVPTDWSVGVFFDYRVLGSLRSHLGNRRDASR